MDFFITRLELEAGVEYAAGFSVVYLTPESGDGGKYGRQGL